MTTTVFEPGRWPARTDPTRLVGGSAVCPRADKLDCTLWVCVTALASSEICYASKRKQDLREHVQVQRRDVRLEHARNLFGVSQRYIVTGAPILLRRRLFCDGFYFDIAPYD